MSYKLITLKYVKYTFKHYYQAHTREVCNQTFHNNQIRLVYNQPCPTNSYHSYMVSAQSTMSSKLIHGKYTIKHSDIENQVNVCIKGGFEIERLMELD